MGKNKDKNKEDVPNPTSVTNRDILQRLNFLYQASVLLNGLAPPDASVHRDNSPPRPPMTSSDKNTGTVDSSPRSCPRSLKKRKRSRRVVGLEELSRSYVETMKSVGQKTNVRMDPSIKRCICKHCHAPLIPGVSATVRIKDSASHGHLVSYQCQRCQTERRVPAPPVLYTADPPANDDATEGQRTSHTLPPLTGMSIGNAVPGGHRQQRKKGPQPRLPPHFARDVGHVIFRGNELLDAARSIS